MGLTTFRVSRGFTYSYTHIRPADGASKPYVLFLHGFPALSSIWDQQIEYFGNLGYGVIAPDLLGYGRSSCPTSVSSYRFKFMAQDLVEILDNEGIEAVHAVGHDWGAGFLSRLEFFFPERIIKMALVGTAYLPPGQTFDLDTMNAATEEKFGYSAYGYLNFFTQNPNAAGLLDNHVSTPLSRAARHENLSD
jgi:pimeloyl-ACP methyl ester carboxylesterase